MSERDHIVVIHPRTGREIRSGEMPSESAHELFAFLTSYFEGVEITIEQMVPVAVETRRRVLWVKREEGGPNQHIADAVYPDGEPA